MSIRWSSRKTMRFLLFIRSVGAPHIIQVLCEKWILNFWHIDRLNKFARYTKKKQNWIEIITQCANRTSFIYKKKECGSGPNLLFSVHFSLSHQLDDLKATHNHHTDQYYYIRVYKHSSIIYSIKSQWWRDRVIIRKI